ncbi:MAG: response regulator [Bacteriovoracaceae bacterium]|nr:response regulator [Bacteriovoracaceae bacterium]
MSKKRLLIVDDEKIILDLLQDLLTLEGYIVSTACNGLQGLEKFNESRPDLVMTDMMMPLMNGRDLIKEIRKNPVNNNIPIILTSSMSNVSAFTNEGWQLFIKKPSDIDFIIESIKVLLDKYNTALG